MRELLILIVTELNPSQAAVLDSVYQHIKRDLTGVHGFKGVSLWRSATTGDRYLIAVESAVTRETQIVEDTVLMDALTLIREPARVVKLRVREQVGPILSESPADAFLSTSDRVAEPGMGEELASDLQSVFAELRLMEGCIGTVVASNETLEEETVGLVTWSQKQAFHESLPAKQPYQVRLYNRMR